MALYKNNIDNEIFKESCESPKLRKIQRTLKKYKHGINGSAEDAEGFLLRILSFSLNLNF